MDNEYTVVTDEAPAVKPQRQAKMVDVTIIKIVSGVALVEWLADKRLARGFVPLSVIQDEKVDAEELAAAAPFGVVWEKYLRSTEAQEIAEDMRRMGVWTLQDLDRGDPRVAFRRYAETLFGEFIKKVKEHSDGE